MTEKQVKEVAKLALVHERTVYRWLNDPNRCTESVRVRIEAAMKKLKVKP
jgi:DNA-binding LacI/PurR family transcriptional regulator